MVNTLLIASLDFKPPAQPEYFVEFGALLDPVEDMLNHLFFSSPWACQWRWA